MKRFFLIALFLLSITLLSFHSSSNRATAETANPAAIGADHTSEHLQVTATPFAQGISVMAPVQLDTSARVVALQYDWMKIYEPQHTFPSTGNTLLRIDVTDADYMNLNAFRNRVNDIVGYYGYTIEAYEIGNEPNLSQEWGASPDADHFADVLCVAYTAVKTNDSSATVVSGGLATVGRVVGSFDGHPGHNGVVQDEREFIQEFIAAGGPQCTDAIGYHPLGFRADYDAEPDIDGGTPETNCDNGFCFRTVEKIHDILVDAGLENKPIWATEAGWITDPPAHCLTTPTWYGRSWQIVSEEKQEENIAGAFTYAQLHWPWLKGLFIFNFNFDEAPYYDECEQMRFYSVDGPVLPTISHVYLPVSMK